MARHHTPTLRLREIATLARGRMPGQLVIQFADTCNATCPQCSLRVTNTFPRSVLPVDDVKRIIDAAVRQGVQAISLTGGEPFIYQNDIIELLHYCGTAGIHYSRTGTNGFMFRKPGAPGWDRRIHGLAEALAGTGIYTFWISIDSAEPAVHEQMRGLDGVIAGMERALDIFREYDIYPAANLGINRNVAGWWNECWDGSLERFEPDRFYDYFRAAFDRFYRFVGSLGFISSNACYPMSVDESETGDLNNLYGASSPDQLVRFTGEEKAVLFQALLDTIPEHCGDLRIFTPLTSLYALSRYYTTGIETGFACPGGIDYFFIDAQTGDTYPCGFRGNENLGKIWDIDRNSLHQPAFCRKCDWECFRDPGDILGPVLELRNAPHRFIRRMMADRDYLRFWQRDIAYQRACSFFHCRVLPNFEAMKRFARPNSLRATTVPTHPGTTIDMPAIRT